MDQTDLTIAYVGGGSRQWAPRLIQDLAVSPFDGTVRLYDVDVEAAETNAAFGDWVDDRPDATADWSYVVEADLDAALAGADVVVLSTQYDPRETFVHDLDIPLEYGIHGAVSATIGPGGIMRAMRTIPQYRRFARAIRDQCPDAWVCVYTNPIHFVTRALYDEFPDINAIGLCHEVAGTRRHLAAIASAAWDREYDASDVRDTVTGINHFTWLTDVRVGGRDLRPVLEKRARSPAANRRFTPAELADESPFVDNWQVTWELFRRFDALPAAGDRHLVEYATWFLRGGAETLARWGVKRTGSDYRSTHWTPADSEQTTDVTAWMRGEAPFELTRSDEVFVDVVAGLCGEDEFVTNVNLPNRGQVPDLPAEVAVETNAIVRADGITPLTADPLPRAAAGLVRDHVETIESVIAASRTGDVDAAFAGLLTDAQVRTCSPDDARDMFVDLVDAQRDYLEDWDLAAADVLADAGAGCKS